MRKLVTLLLCVVLSALQLNAQNKTITGKVLDEKGSPISGASIIVKGTKIGATSNEQGLYSITVPNIAKTLVVTSVGMTTKEVEIKGNSVNISLTTEDANLQEVVVIGYETKKKKDLAGATARVKGADIANNPTGNFARSMQGTMAGVQVNSFNGVPGGNVTVRIRGVGSINASNTPLFIVDGVQIVTGNSNGLSSGNGPESALSSNLLNSINPSDIETIDVLKDPASASIYGAQAANGVVIITTKKGKQGKSKINFSTYQGFSNVIKRLDVLNATDAVQLGYEAYSNRYGATNANTLGFLTQVGATVDPKGMINPLQNNDWQALAFIQGRTANYDLSVSGGNEKTTFVVSGGYQKIEGHVVGSDYQRGSLRLSIEHKATDRFTIGTNLSLSSYSANGVYNGGSFGNPVRNGYLSFPTNTPFLPDGSYRSASNGTWFGGIDNFLTYTNFNTNFANTKNLIGAVNLTYKINKSLTFRSAFNLNWNLTEEKQFDDPRYSGASTNGSVTKNSTQIRDFQTNQVLNYNQVFGYGKHAVTGLLGAEYRYNLNTSYSASGIGLPLPQFQTLSSTATPNAPSEGFSDFKIAGVFGKVGYTYDDKYIFNFTIRRDGSSRFGENNKFGWFPSVSTAWKISKEKFFGERFSNNNDIKLRFSYGITGNQAGIGNYASRNLFGLSGEYLGLSGGAPSQLGNSELSWEENETFNLGADFSLFNRSVTLEIDAFQSDRRKLLLSVPLPTTSGFSSITQNVGVLRNKGIEIGINTVNIDKKDFRWTTNFNFSFVKNEVTQLAPGQTQIGTGTKIGRQLNSIFTYKFAGVNPADGRPFYNDTLGNLTYVPQLRDRYYLDGTTDPTFFGGLTNNIRYKNFEFRFQFNYQGGNYIQNSDAAFLQRAGSTVDRNQAASQIERWTKPGDLTRVPRPYQGGTQPNAASNSFTSDRFFERGDFLRLKEVTLSFNFDKSLLKRFNIANASFYVSGYNLATWTKYSMIDPELTGNDFGVYPQAKQVTVGLNITF